MLAISRTVGGAAASASAHVSETAIGSAVCQLQLSSRAPSAKTTPVAALAPATAAMALMLMRKLFVQTATAEAQ